MSGELEEFPDNRILFLGGSETSSSSSASSLSLSRMMISSFPSVLTSDLAGVVSGVSSSSLGGSGSQVPSLWRTISCSSDGSLGDLEHDTDNAGLDEDHYINYLISSVKNPSIRRLSTRAGLLQTGQIHFCFL